MRLVLHNPDRVLVTRRLLPAFGQVFPDRGQIEPGLRMRGNSLPRFVDFDQNNRIKREVPCIELKPTGLIDRFGNLFRREGNPHPASMFGSRLERKAILTERVEPIICHQAVRAQRPHKHQQ